MAQEIISVFLGRKEIFDGQIISKKDGLKHLSILWDPEDDYLYTVLLKKDGEIYLHKTGVHNVGDGEDLIQERAPEQSGSYIIELYKENGKNKRKISTFSFIVEQSGSEKFVTKNIEDLTLEQRKHCSCVVQVAEKQTKECLETKRWRDVLEGKQCYNPHAVCGRLKRPSDNCHSHYNYREMSNSQLISYARLNDIKLPVGKFGDKERQELIGYLETKK